MKLKPWSKLQKQVYNLISEQVDIQLHCSAYPMRSMWHGSTDLPRYWVTLGRQIIWDYPKDFIAKNVSRPEKQKYPYPYDNDASKISQLLREYVDTPKKELFSKTFDNDKWGLADILRAADRRVGKRQLAELQNATENEAALKIIAVRLTQKHSPGKRKGRQEGRDVSKDERVLGVHHFD